MQSSELLQIIGEAAVALTGFSGVVAVLGHRGRGEWSSEELLQLRTLVEPGFVALFGSLLPGTVHLAFESEALVWRLSNAALALLSVAGVVGFLARSRSASTTTGQRVLLVMVVLAIGAQLLAAGGVLMRHELIFVLSLILALMVAAYNFSLLLFPARRAT
jgi:hypothetical protein